VPCAVHSVLLYREMGRANSNVLLNVERVADGKDVAPGEPLCNGCA
jgi:hypothetical protein